MAVRPPALIRPLALLAGFWACCGALHVEAQEKAQLPVVLTTKPLKEAPGDTDERKLLKALYNERQTIAAGHWIMYLGASESTNEQLLDSSRRMLQAGLEAYDKPKDKLELLQQMLVLSKKLDAVMEGRASIYRTNLLRDLDHARAREFKTELDLQILRIKKASGDR